MNQFFKNKYNMFFVTNHGAGPALVLIHGNSLSSKSFVKQLNDSSLKKYKITAIDLPGHGNSQRAVNPSKTYSVNGFVREVSEFIESKFHEPVILVGHSLGGHIALETAGILPNIKGLVIFGTPPMGKPPEMERAFKPHRSMVLAFKGELDEKEALDLCKGYLGPTDQIPKEFIEDILSVDIVMRTKLAESIESEEFNDELKIINNLKIPIAIFHCEKDELVNLDYIKNITAPNLWQNKIHLIKNAYHSPQFEQPEEFNELLDNFIKDIIN